VTVRDVTDHRFREGDLVKVASLNDKLMFCIIGFKTTAKGDKIAILKGLYNQDLIIEKPITEAISRHLTNGYAADYVCATSSSGRSPRPGSDAWLPWVFLRNGRH
jgi:hypothetical protein